MFERPKIAAHLVCLLLLGCGYSIDAANAQSGEPPAKVPPKMEKNCRVIDFETAEVKTDAKGQHLVVEGKAPYRNMSVDLIPLIYVMQPEYWGITVRGCIKGDIALPALKPFRATLSLAGSIGSKGIEVLGRSKSKRIEIRLGDK